MPRTITEYRESLAADNDGIDPYADLTDQQFAARLHQRHYSDLPFDAFAQRVGLQGNYQPAGPRARPRSNPANNMTIDGRNPTQMAMDQALEVARPAPMLPPDPRVAAMRRDPQEEEQLRRTLGRLPGNIGTQAGAMYRRAGAGVGRLTSDINARMGAAAAESYRDPFFRPSGAPGGMTPGIIEEGTVDLSNRPQVRNPDGSVSTVRSTSFGIEDGKVILVPTVTDDGRIVTPEEAMQEYRRTGKHLGIFDSQESADRYAERLHEAQEEASGFGQQQEVAAQEAEGRAFKAELAAGRMGRVERRAAGEAAAAMPEDAGPIERAVQSGLASTLATAPIVTAGALIPGGQAPALVALGGMTGAQRYGELRAAGMGEGESALSAAYLGGLEALTEKMPMGAIAKNSPFLNRAAEFLVTDLLGENINTATQIADDYRLGLNENVTMEDVKQALADTTAATIVGAGATLSLAELTKTVLEHANGLAAAREPQIPTLMDAVEPPTLTEEVASAEEGAPAEEITLEGDGEQLPGEIGVGELDSEEITLETDPVAEWRAEQEAIEDPELDQVAIEDAADTPPGIEPQPEPLADDPGPKTMAERRAASQEKHERLVRAVTTETKPMGVTYAPGENGWHGVAVDGRPYAWYRSEAVAREEVRQLRADIAAGRLKPEERDEAIARELPRQSVSARAHEAATSPENDLPEPTPAQINAGNYRKGHVRVSGFDISIENPVGSIRRSKPDAPKKWQRTMRDGYGYIRGTEDNTGEHVDVFVGNNPEAGQVYVIDQVIDGKFDEPKVMMGYDSEEAASKAYHRNYQRGWTGLGAITPMSVEDFRGWLERDGAKRPVKWKPALKERVSQHADQLRHMGERAGWQEIGGQAITQGDAVRADVVGRTKWLPKEPWFAEVQRAAPLPANAGGKATAAAVAKALAGEKLTAAESRHVNAMADAIEAEREEDARLAQTLDESPEKLSDAEIAAIEARLERLAVRLEAHEKKKPKEPELPAGPGIQSDVPMFERKGQGDLFGGTLDVKNALKKLEAEKDRRRNSGQQSAETGKPGDLFSQARQQADIEDKPLRRRSTPRPGALDERSVRDEVNRVLREFKTRPRLMVVQKPEQLPADLKQALRARGELSGDARALQWNGGIYFIADRFHKIEDVVDSVLHETVVHFGLRSVLDRDTHRAILDGVWRDQKMAVRRMGVEEFGSRWNSDDPWMRRIAAEEVLAYYAPQYLKGKDVPEGMKPWLQRLIDAIRVFVNRILKLERPAVDLENFQLPKQYNKRGVDQIIDALQAHLKRGTTPDYVNEGDALAERRTVEVERKRYPITDANGKLVAETPREQMNFWRWARGTKVVDGHGQPLVMYHGTGKDLSRLEGGHGIRPGLHSQGIWFTPSRESASEYAMYAWEGQKNVMPVYLQIKNPKNIGASQADLWNVDELKAQGYDGAFDLETSSWIAFDSSQIKSAIGNRGTFDPDNPDILAERSRPVFYSALTRAVEESKTVRAPAAQWLATLRNAPGVKTEEIEWSGVAEWLQSLGRPATREQLAEYLRANEIQIEETVHGMAPARDENDPAVQLRFAVDDMLVNLDALGYTVVVQQDDDDAKFIQTVVNRRTDEEYEYTSANGTVEWVDRKGGFLPEQIRELIKSYQANLDAQAELDAEHQAAYGGENRYGNYTLPGGENYRELLLTLPAAGAKWQVFRTLNGNVVASYDEREDALRDVMGRGPGYDYDLRDSPQNSNLYRSSHWDEPNILAHVRFNERTDADGRRVLFVEEIQSDWHQAGRRHGYKLPAKRAEQLETRRRELEKIGGSARDRGEEIPQSVRTEWAAVMNELQPENVRRVPDAPFKTTWPELAFKRVIRWAAENGFDRIAWTTGKQQADRYNLRKHISKLEWRQLDEVTGELKAWSVDGGNVIDRVTSHATLPDIVGAELAARILSTPVSYTTPRGRDVRVLEGLDLEVGGEGMTGFYDDILPKAVNKLVKKWGARVGSASLSRQDWGISGQDVMDDAGIPRSEQDTWWSNNARDRERLFAKLRATPIRVHAVDVTPEMRDAAMEGLPMFQRAAGSTVQLRNLPKGSQEAGWYAKTAGRVIDAWNKKIGHKYGALGNLPESRKYLIERYRALGGLTQVREVSREIFKALSAADEADAQRVYTYLTTAGALPDDIESEPVRAAAVNVKQMIDEQGQALVESGLLDEGSFEKYRDQYLPRLYLRHILDDKGRGRMMGSGKKLSDLGYLKQRKDIPEEVRKVILGEITDPAFLAAFGVSRTMRDLTIMNFLQTIAQNKAWAPEQMLIDWDGRKVSPYWLQSEAKQLRRQADHIKNVMIAGKARAIADRMDTAANAALDALDAVSLDDFKQIPDSARYGALRGAYVRKEIHEDLVGAYQFIETDSVLESIFGQGGFLTKATQAWKTSKVAMNVPSHFRNMMGNAMMLHLSGMPLARVPDRLASAIASVVNRDEWYEIAKKYGLREATFANTELYRIRDEWLLLQKSKQPTANVLHAMFAKITDKVGDVYQFEEALFKIAKLRDAMEREGLGEADAMIESHKWIFDYSLVPRWVRYLRNAPFGIPFLSYAYFALPRLAEVAIRRPWKFLPYIAVVTAMEQSIMAMFGADDDDLEKLRAAYPDWMRSRGGMMLMPWKDNGGRWQVVDMGYTVPWGQLADVTAQISEGNFRQSAETMGLFSGPLPDVVAAWQTNRDPFTGREIANGGDPKWKQALSILNYAWGMAAPGFITNQGALGKIRDAYTGRVDPRTGEPTLTTSQALLRLFGVSIYPVDPEVTRSRNIRAMSFEIDEVRRRLGEQMRDKNLTEEQRQEIRKVYAAEIKLRQEKLRRYQQESEIPENLRRRPEDLTGRIAPFIDGKSKRETIRALRDAGYPALAELFNELPAKPRPAVLEALQVARA